MVDNCFSNSNRIISNIQMVTNSLDWIAAFLNRRSREHRYVAYVLSQERKKLKEKKGEVRS